jgi:hypothetical protein
MRLRGQQGQMKKLEKIMEKVFDLGVMTPVTLDHMGEHFPPSQQTMDEMYGNHASAMLPTSAHPKREPVHFEHKEYDVTNTCAQVCGCLCTCGIAGCMKQTVHLDPNELRQHIKDNCTNDDLTEPYGQMNSVDDNVHCCCCYEVNGFSPGCGCRGTEVKALADDLQERKVERGDIAQLKNQEATMWKAKELGVMVDLVLRRRGLKYPPEPGWLSSKYGANVPKLPEDFPAPIASKQFENVSFNATNYCDLCCACMTTNLHLEEDEAVLIKWSPCDRTRTRMPYAQLGGVENEEFFGGVCTNTETDAGELCPGCGCKNDLTKQMSEALYDRKVYRGNIAQIEHQENLIKELIKLNIKMDMLVEGQARNTGKSNWPENE